MQRFVTKAELFLVLLIGAACSGPQPQSPSTAEVEQVLDDWHAAAAAADEAVYFGLMAADAVFLGTDAAERWSREEFRAYAHPHFASGRGWTYRPRQRGVAFDPTGGIAWFDELLDSDKYGELRGTGVLRRDGPGWRIVHYSMTFTVPNESSAALLELLRGGPGTAQGSR